MQNSNLCAYKMALLRKVCIYFVCVCACVCVCLCVPQFIMKVTHQIHILEKNKTKQHLSENK